MKVLETERLALRTLTPDDAEFVRELVNEPSWIRLLGKIGLRFEQTIDFAGEPTQLFVA
ncbi:MAG TPA: hypothetical protein VII36_04845 [Usitatibacter sp.]